MMKPMVKSLIAASIMAASVGAQAGLSANVGVTSDYLFRGGNLSDGVALYSGIDYEAENGFFAGAWGIGFDDALTTPQEDELEVDLYFGYGNSVGDFSYSVGYTGYFYDKSATDFHELNFNLGYSFLNLEVTFGTEDDDNVGGTDEDYIFTALTAEYAGAYLTYGEYSEDFDGSYVELGYGASVQGVDLGIAYVNAEDQLSNPDDTVYVTLTKTFDL